MGLKDLVSSAWWNPRRTKVVSEARNMADSTPKPQREISQAELANAKRFGSFCPVYQVDPATIVKTGDSIRLTEAETMKFVRENTKIPVPEVYAAYVDRESGHVRIVMEFVEGDKLETTWNSYTASQKDDILRQLRQYFVELRKIKGSFIGCIDKTACEDPLFDDELGGYGPYQSEIEFNEGIVTALKRAEQGPWVDVVCDMVTTHLTDHDIVLTHGDFAPRNVLVKGTKVVALLDWEVAGFFPSYWEYVKAMRRPEWESKWNEDKSVDRVLDPCLKELSIIWNTRDIIW